MNPLTVALVLALAWSAPALGQGAGPVFAPSGPEADDYGAREGYPAGDKTSWFRSPHLVGALSQIDRVFPVRETARPAAAWAFKRAEKEAQIAYTYEGARRGLADYLARHPATGLLIAKDDTILYEHYQYGRTDRHRFLSQSMAKTVTAMLVGIALDEGAIRALDDAAEAYVPALKGSEYGRTPIRALLNMASGVEFREDYGGADDNARMGRDLRFATGKSTAQTLAQFNTRVAPPGTRFHYASSETMVLGLVLRAATGKPVAEYLADKIWRPIGAESDAAWTLDVSGQEMVYCCFSAVLRDYARLGRLLAHDGAWDGKQVVPRQWVLDATTVKPGEDWRAPRRATPFFGYGYQVWLFPDQRRRFAFLGAHGQAIYVDPATKLVLVHTAVRKRPSGDPGQAELTALWRGVLAQYGN